MEIKKRMLKSVQVLRPEQSLAEAFELLSKSDLKLLPVIEKDQVVGIISYKDIVHFLAIEGKSEQAAKNWNKTAVRLIMTKDVKTISPQTDFLEAAELMRAHKISGLPVGDKGILVGFVSETTILEEYIAISSLT